MLTDSEITYCENKCLRIIGCSGSEKNAMKKLRKFSFRGSKLNTRECHILIEMYKQEYGSISQNTTSKTKRIRG